MAWPTYMTSKLGMLQLPLAPDVRVAFGSRRGDRLIVTSRSGGKRWIDYMSDPYIRHCLDTIDKALDGVGAFVRRYFETATGAPLDRLT